MALAHCSDNLFFKISLAEWSLHRSLQKGEISNLDFPRIARTRYNIDAIEYVSVFFQDKADDKEYLQQLKDSCRKYNVISLIIMVDDEGNIGHIDQAERHIAVKKHLKWIRAANFLGCHSIRVSLQGEGCKESLKKAAVDGLTILCDYAELFDINVIVENRLGLSSDAEWLADIIQRVNKSNCGTFPDFGNFGQHNKYKGVEQLMPFAKGVSGKSYDFDDNGDETTIDYLKMLQIIKNLNYDGYIDIEYEGQRLTEDDGIKATKELLLKAGKYLQVKMN
jgi:sugar phosphate isomerase/epimerase